jgi:hypothetical protein
MSENQTFVVRIVAPSYTSDDYTAELRVSAQRFYVDDRGRLHIMQGTDTVFTADDGKWYYCGRADCMVDSPTVDGLTE